MVARVRCSCRDRSSAPGWWRTRRSGSPRRTRGLEAPVGAGLDELVLAAVEGFDRGEGEAAGGPILAGAVERSKAGWPARARGKQADAHAGSGPDRAGGAAGRVPGLPRRPDQRNTPGRWVGAGVGRVARAGGYDALCAAAPPLRLRHDHDHDHDHDRATAVRAGRTVSYGPNLSAAAVPLGSEGNVPVERTAMLIHALLGGEVSTGFVARAAQRLADKLDVAGLDEAMKPAVRSEEVHHRQPAPRLAQGQPSRLHPCPAAQGQGRAGLAVREELQDPLDESRVGAGTSQPKAASSRLRVPHPSHRRHP